MPISDPRDSGPLAPLTVVISHTCISILSPFLRPTAQAPLPSLSVPEVLRSAYCHLWDGDR